MGCPSPAALLVKQAREAELEDLPTHADEDIDLLMRAAGAPRSWLDDYLDSSSEASSDSGEASCSDMLLHDLSGSVNSAVKAEVRQQQQVEMQILVGRLICQAQQIDLAEEWGLESIAIEFAQRQEDLMAEEDLCQEELAVQRNAKLQELQHELNAKAQQSHEAQQTIRSQEHERQQQQQAQKLRELEAQKQHQEELDRRRLEQQQQLQQQQQLEQQQQQRQQQERDLQQQQQQQQQASTQAAQPQNGPPLLPAVQQPAAGSQRDAEPQLTPVDPNSLLRVSEAAAAEEAKYREALQKAEASVRAYKDDDACKKERRSIDKQLLLLIQQISGTQEHLASVPSPQSPHLATSDAQASPISLQCLMHCCVEGSLKFALSLNLLNGCRHLCSWHTEFSVHLKSEGILELLGQLSGPPLTFAYLQLTRKLLIQCEVQIAQNLKSCFPIAEVTATVAAHHPELAPLLIAKMQEVCPLTVPKCYIAVKGAQKQYQKLMRFQESQDARTGQVTFERADAYMKRNSGFVALYAALAQSDRRGNPTGLDNAWRYLARLLNSLPVNRASGTALVAFLSVAGYRMFCVYKGQFIKLLKYIFDHFHVKLVQSNDPDAKAIAARLGQYINEHLYHQVPEGQQLPKHDLSTDLGLYT